MKIQASVLTAAIMSVSIMAAAEEHNYIYRSDIRTYIDNQEITSYNIGGKTLIKAADLRRYGFEVDYDDEIRTVTIEALAMPSENPTLSEYEFEGMYVNSGDILGETVITDIDVYFGSHKVTSYNTGGNMLICVEEMAQTVEGSRYTNDNAQIGYSDLGFKMNYDDTQRRLDLYSLREGVTLDTPYGTGNVVGYGNRMWEFYGYYKGGSISENERVDYSEKIIAGETDSAGDIFYSCNDLFEYAGISYEVRDKELYITIPDSYAIVKPQRWSATNHSTDTSFTPIFEVNACVNGEEKQIKIMTISGELYISDDDMSDMGLIEI